VDLFRDENGAPADEGQYFAYARMEVRHGRVREALKKKMQLLEATPNMFVYTCNQFEAQRAQPGWLRRALFNKNKGAHHSTEEIEYVKKLHALIAGVDRKPKKILMKAWGLSRTQVNKMVTNDALPSVVTTHEGTEGPAIVTPTEEEPAKPKRTNFTPADWQREMRNYYAAVYQNEHLTIRKFYYESTDRLRSLRLYQQNWEKANDLHEALRLKVSPEKLDEFLLWYRQVEQEMIPVSANADQQQKRKGCNILTIDEEDLIVLLVRNFALSQFQITNDIVRDIINMWLAFSGRDCGSINDETVRRLMRRYDVENETKSTPIDPARSAQANVNVQEAYFKNVDRYEQREIDCKFRLSCLSQHSFLASRVF